MGYIGAGISRFNTADELTVTGDATIDTTTLVVDSTNNNVGIGTATPEDFGSGYTTLEVAGSSTANGGIFKTATSDSAGTGTAGTEMLMYSNNGGGVIAVTSSDPLLFQTAGAERMRLTSGGLVMVGTTTEGISDYGDTLTLADTGHAGMTIRSGTSSEGNVYFSDGTSGDAEYKGIVKYDHSSNAMSFWSNSLRRVTIDSSGNLLVGKTSSNIGTAGSEVTPTYISATRADNSPLFLNRTNSDGSIITFRKDNSAAGSIGVINNNNLIISNDADNSGLQFGSGSITPAYDGAGQNNSVDLGSSSTRFKDGYFSNAVRGNFFTGQADDNTYMGITGGDVITFATGGSERARFDSSGNFLIGTTNAAPRNFSSSTYGIRFIGDQPEFGIDTAYFNKSNGAGTLINFRQSGTDKGTIAVSSSGTTYNTTSDIRLKQDIEPLEATDKLMAMNPVSYSWKADPDGQRSMGFIAQEMADVMPEAVSTGDDDMMSMDYGRITPILVSALQDAHRKIDELAAEIAELKAN